MRLVSRFIYALLVVVVVSSVGFGCSSSDTEGSSSPVSGEFSAGNGGTVENNQGVSVEVSGDAVSGTTVVKVKITVIGDYAVFDDAAYEALGQAVEVTSEPAGATFDDGKVTVTMPCDADKSRVRIIELDEADDDSWSVGSVDIECDESSDTYTFSVSKTGVFALATLFGEPLQVLQERQMLALGYGHTCAIDDGGSDNKLWCWGRNLFGQLGLGNKDDKSTPQVVELGGIPKLAVSGSDHTCTLVDVDGVDTVKCWGDNGFGQLGINSTERKSTPQTVDVGGTPKALDAGQLNTCVIVYVDGVHTVKCWGNNIEGQLGINSTEDQLTTPQTVDLGGNAKALSMFNSHTCAIADVDGVDTLKCWGDNDHGQLGINSTERKSTPQTVDVGGIPKQVWTGTLQTCALVDVDGVDTLKCWGYNQGGELGINGNADQLTPQTIDINGHVKAMTWDGFTIHVIVEQEGKSLLQYRDGSGWTQWDIGSGNAIEVDFGHYQHVCMTVAESGSTELKCWGDDNRFGQLGDGGTDSRSGPPAVSLDMVPAIQF